MFRPQVPIIPRRRVALVLAACAAVLVACAGDGVSTRTATRPGTPTTGTSPPVAGSEPPISVPRSSEPDAPALPPSDEPSEGMPSFTLPPLLPNADGAYDRYRGVGAYDAIGCTAFLVDAGVDDAPAYALTNGHCVVSPFDTTTVLLDAPGYGSVLFDYFVDTTPIPVPVVSVAWGTMRGIDVGVLRLDSTLGELRVTGVVGYHLGSFVDPGDPLRLVGVPASGADGAFLRATDCTAGAATRVLEGEWIFDRVMPSDCVAIGGNSGSPMFAADGSVAGILNTGTFGETPGDDCVVNHPCEITASGTERHELRSYAQPVDRVAACFTAAGEFDVSTCDLEGSSDTVELGAEAGVTSAAVVSVIDAPSGPLVAKGGTVTATDCRVADGYAAFDPAAEIDVPASADPMVVCVAPGTAGAVDLGAASFEVLDPPAGGDLRRSVRLLQPAQP
jgi:V8-like Glu-specific endopeptidase